MVNLLDDVASSSNELGAIAEAAQRMQVLEDEIKELDDQLKAKKQSLQNLSETELPDLMLELNVKDFTLTDGSKVTVQDIVSASIPSAGSIGRASGDAKEELVDRQQSCFDWLRKNGGRDLIKSNIEVQFGKGEDKNRKKFAKELRDKKLFYKESMGVHPQTLKAFISECLQDGKNVPFDVFKIYTGQIAK